MADKRVWSQGRPLTAVEVEDLLMEMLDALEDAAIELKDAGAKAAKAEYEYRKNFARQFSIGSPPGTPLAKTEEQRRQYAVGQCAELLEARLDAAAERDAAAELCRVRRAQVEILRTVAANARAAETGRG